MEKYFVVVKGHLFEFENGIFIFDYYDDAAEFCSEIMLDKEDEVGCENLSCSIYKANEITSWQKGE